MNPPDPAARVPLSLLRLCAPWEGPGELPDAGSSDAGTDRDCPSLRPGGGRSTSAKYRLPVFYLRIIVLMSPEGERREAGTTGLTTQAQAHARTGDVPTENNTDGCRTHCVVSAQTPQAPSPA